MKNNNKKYSLKYINKPILILTLLLAGVGAFLILDASSISAQLTYGYDTPYYFYRQCIYIIYTDKDSVFCRYRQIFLFVLIRKQKHLNNNFSRIHREKFHLRYQSLCEF